MPEPCRRGILLVGKMPGPGDHGRADVGHARAPETVGIGIDRAASLGAATQVEQGVAVGGPDAAAWLCLASSSKARYQSNPAVSAAGVA